MMAMTQQLNTLCTVRFGEQYNDSNRTNEGEKKKKYYS